MKFITILFVLCGLNTFAQQDSVSHVVTPQPTEQTPAVTPQPKPTEQTPAITPQPTETPAVTPQPAKQQPTVKASEQPVLKKDSVRKVTPLKPKFDWSKVYVGGDLGLSFGTLTAVNLSPIIGYKLTPKFSAGVGITYIYYSNTIIKYQYSIYGGSIFSRYQLFKFLFAHVEYQTLNGPWDDYYNRRYFINNFWVGGGLSQPIGGNSSIALMILWNLNRDGYISYPPSPWIRMGINIGL